MPTDNNRSNQDENLSSSFSQFSQSLGRSSQALLDASKKFENIFNDFINDFEDITNESNNSSRSNGNQMTSNMSKMFERSDKNMKNAMTMGQKISSTLITSLSVIGGRVVKEFETAFDNVYNKYKSSFSNITVRMGMSHKEYQDMWNAASASFQSQGLNKQFSPVDFADALESVLSTGLRGDIAEQKAMHDLVSQKLVPAISTNTIAYRRMTKEFGTSIQDHVTAIAKYTEQVYGAEGIDEGKFDQMYSTLEAQIRYAAGGDQEKAQQAIDALTAQMAVLEKNNIDSDTYIQELYNAFTGEIGTNSPMSAMWGSFTPDKAIEAMMSGDTIAQYVNAYSNNGATASNADYLNAYTSAMGGNMQTGYEVGAFIRGGGSAEDLQKQMDDLLNGFDADAVITKETKRLQDGFYQNVDDQLTKIEENTMTGPAVWAAEIPRFKELASDVKSILSAVVSNFLFTKTLGGGNGGNLLSKAGNAIKGKLNSGFDPSTTFASRFADGMAYNSSLGGQTFMGSAKLGNLNAGIQNALGTTGGTGFGGASSALGAATNVLAGPVALAAGLVWGGVDAAEAVKRSDGGMDAVGQGIRGFITGGSRDTDEEALAKASGALSGQKVKMDWGEVGKNTGKGALIGTGVGTAVGGWAAGLGTVVGAGVGAITGAVTSMIDQAVENAKYNKLADAVNESTEALEKLSQAQSNYEKVINDSKTTEEYLNQLGEDSTATAEQQNEAFAVLQEKYPELLGNISDQSELDANYIALLREKIKLEQELGAGSALDAANETLGSVEDILSKQADISGDKYRSAAAIDAVQALYDASGGENGKRLSSEEIDAVLNDVSSKYNVDKSELLKEVNSGESGAVIKTKDDGSYVLTGQKGGGATAGDNMKQYLEDYKDTSKDYQSQMQTALNKVLSENLAQSYMTIAQTITQFEEDIKNDTLTPSVKESLDKTVATFNEQVESYKDQAREFDLYGIAKNNFEKQFPNINEVFEKGGYTAPSFKVGSYEIPSDQLAQLHQGEMVLTASNAEALRQIDANGLQGALSTMKEIASASPVEDTTTQTAMSNLIVASINSQTETLGNYLMTIVGYLSRLSPASSVNADNTAQLSEALLTYAGV